LSNKPICGETRWGNEKEDYMYVKYKDYLEVKDQMLLDLGCGIDFKFIAKYNEYYRLYNYLRRRNLEYIENYKGNDIYGNEELSIYVPYYDCGYYFTTLEDCRCRIDNKIGILVFGGQKGGN
jgi:hypothetical protein